MNGLTLLLVGFVGGLLAGVSPCVLPVLPVVLMGGAAGPSGGGAETAVRRRRWSRPTGRDRRRPGAEFALITLFGTLLLAALHLPASLLRWLGLGALVVVGLAMLIPRLEQLLDRAFAKIPQRNVTDKGSGTLSGFILGLALGAVFVPCAGPVLAAIAVAGATGTIGAETVLLTLAFAAGVSIPIGLRPGRQPHLDAGPGLPTPPTARPRCGRSAGHRTGRSADLRRDRGDPAPHPRLHQVDRRTPAGQDHSLQMLHGNGSLRRWAKVFSGTDDGLADSWTGTRVH